MTMHIIQIYFNIRFSNLIDIGIYTHIQYSYLKKKTY